jgi:purine-binding chemotaxis protein CheW
MSAPTQLLTFKTQGRWYACDLLWVREILRQPVITPVDRAPLTVRGLIHLRGQILTALDLDQRLGLQPQANQPASRCVVFKSTVELARLALPPAEAEMAGTDLLGIIVDEVGDILTRPDNVLPPPPELMSGMDHACVSGVIPRPMGLITLLNIGALLSLPASANS